VRPGDTLRARFTVLEAQPSSTKPNRGNVTFQSEMVNQDDVVVLRMIGRGLYGKRPE
jgi:acyl dehydratase